MACFQNILAGIDLTRCERLDVACVGTLNENVLARARWLARHSGGRLTLFSSLNERGQPGPPVDPEHPHLPGEVEESPARVLQELVEQARGLGIDGHALLAPGKGGDELLHQVVRGQHDLVLVGARDESGLRRALFTGTTLQLLRQCPCPVWVSRPGPDNLQHILVANDLSPEAEAALGLGVALIRMTEGARLHILHVVAYPLDRLWSTGQSDAWTRAYQRQVRTEAEDRIRAQLERVGSAWADPSVQVHLVDGAGIPDETILEFIQEHNIDLLILGTVARSGLANLLLGNAAERLLAEVRCSVVTVKPPDFRCPVKVE